MKQLEGIKQIKEKLRTGQKLNASETTVLLSFLDTKEETSENKEFNPIIIDDDCLINDFITGEMYSESLDDIVKNNEGFQTMYRVSLNGIYPEFNEFIVVPSFKEAEKLVFILSKLTIKRSEVTQE